MSIRIKTLLRRLALLSAVTVAASTLTPAAASAASPAVSVSVAGRSAQARTAYAARMRGYRIVAAARAQFGKPYRFGARGPSAFDCSGLTGYVYRSVRINLPRTAEGQFRAARPVAKAVARPGDLVFWVRGGRAYHVAVYTGAGQVWHAPKPGRRVHLASIWSWGEVRFGRVGA